MQSDHIPTVPKRLGAQSLQQAMAGSPTLARLAELTRDSSARLRAVQTVVPVAMRRSLQAGPIDEQGWSLMVTSTAAAAKLRQLLPAMEQALRAQGLGGLPIRIKVLTPTVRR